MRNSSNFDWQFYKNQSSKIQHKKVFFFILLFFLFSKFPSFTTFLKFQGLLDIEENIPWSWRSPDSSSMTSGSVWDGERWHRTTRCEMRLLAHGWRWWIVRICLWKVVLIRINARVGVETVRGAWTPRGIQRWGSAWHIRWCDGLRLSIVFVDLQKHSNFNKSSNLNVWTPTFELSNKNCTVKFKTCSFFWEINLYSFVYLLLT